MRPGINHGKFELTIADYITPTVSIVLVPQVVFPSGYFGVSARCMPDQKERDLYSQSCFAMAVKQSFP